MPVRQSTFPPLPEQPFAAIVALLHDPDAPDLSLRQVGVLAHMATHSPNDCKTRLIAAALGISKPAVTRAMHRLEELRFAARTGSPHDRRDVINRITPQGRAWLQRLVPAAASQRRAA